MERLTAERRNGIKSGYWSPAKKEELVQRLGAYEDTGLTPEEIEELQEREKPKSLPARFDPDSVECGNCGKDIDMLENEEYKFCPYCGQRLSR